MSEALEILKSCDAFLEGHFLLSSGRHSSAYCQMAYLQQYPDRCAEVMKAVADKIKEMDVDVIVGPAMGHRLRLRAGPPDRQARYLHRAGGQRDDPEALRHPSG